MPMLLERAASLFQSQGWNVRVRPTILGDSGAIHTPDLHLQKAGERDRAVFVFEELDGHGPLEGRSHMARDMACRPVFVVGAPGPEVAQWAGRQNAELLTAEDLERVAVTAPPPAPPAAAAPPPPAPIPEDSGAELLAPRTPAPPAPRERPLAQFAPPAGLPEDGGAMLLPAKARAPPPAPAEAPAAEPASPADDGGAELLASRPAAVRDPDKMMKHDPTIWDPRQRLAEVKQAAKRGGFETTAARQQPASTWLQGLRRH